MRYNIEFSKKAFKELEKLDKHTQTLIRGWVRKNLMGCTDPRRHGKGLTANRSGLWRYRVGDYRLIAEIQDNKVLILVLSVGHRSKVFEQ